MRIIVTRPEPDGSRQAETLAARGHEVVLAPLLTVEFVRGVPLQTDGAQALIATSRNALRALSAHAERDVALKLPLFAVGEGTARLAQELGFADVTIGLGTGSELGTLIAGELRPEDGPLVHLAGETLAFDLKGALEERGFSVRQPVLYRAEVVETLPAGAASLLGAGGFDGVILMSPRTARIFAALARPLAVMQAKRPVCYCLSKAVADEAAAYGFVTRVPARPREEDVLALVDSAAASS
jgi:uroporphyrinogen-III synthase